jgi:FkbM family methyltransferase
MIKQFIRGILNKYNYDIVKTSAHGSVQYKQKSDIKELDYFVTPTGNYYLPKHLKKDIVANTIKSGGIFEPEIIKLAEKYIKQGGSILDVGANYGQMSICFSKMVSSGRIYSFEAEPFINSILQKNVRANNCTNIRVIGGAVYHKNDEKLVFPEPDFVRFDSYGSYGIDPNRKEGRTVESFTIDSLNIKEPISFMKVDVQGSDLFALMGAKETIQKNKMPIVFEFEQQFQEEFHTTFNDYADFIRDIDYSFKEIIAGINYLIVPKE